jgi:hypothetical protein
MRADGGAAGSRLGGESAVEPRPGKEDGDD